MSLLHECRVAIRTIRRAPGYALPIVLTFALTTGATSAIFSAVYGILLKPLPIREPSRLVVGWQTDPHAAPRTPIRCATARGLRQICCASASSWPRAAG